MAEPCHTPLWQPTDTQIAATQLTAFMRDVERRTGQRFAGYDDLHRFSVTEPALFWQMAWEFVGIRSSATATSVLDDPRRMPGARWFEGARLNFAENLLSRDDDHPAILFRNERMTTSRRITYSELRREVARIAAGLADAGVVAGDRVVGFMPNLPETVIAMLAATSLGAIWSSCSPDFGVRGVLDRFSRIDPKVLFCADGYFYGGKTFDCLEKVAGILAGLTHRPLVIVVHHAGEQDEAPSIDDAVSFSSFGPSEGIARLRFEQLPFDHPVYIMYSSGTTGPPKCIVQSAGGILLNQLKEHRLHVDLRSDERIFYFTTCGWMMWNWLIAGLGVGATIVLFDGSPFQPDPGVLWRLAEEERINVFGTSASYLAALEKEGVVPREHFDLSSLRAILSTGSPLSDRSFEYVYRDIEPDLLLASISGGTDLNGCFVAGCPIRPVHCGEIQCRCLGMDVHAWDDDGCDVLEKPGELVCVSAFPSMPIAFWDDEDGSKYHAAYFERFPGIWTHGDFISINSRGGIRISGRSDATLNPGGVRIGTAEIYRQIDPMDEVADSVVVGHRVDDDVRVILFVMVAEGHTLSDDLRERIKASVRTNCSPRHVPARIIAVPDIPYTLSGKKVELAVRDLIHGRPVRNRDALRNPESLDGFRHLDLS